MIVVNKNANITHLPYVHEGSRGIYSFAPGQNQIDPEVWAAVKKTAGKRMAAHYNAFLKPINESNPEDEIDLTSLNADDFIDLVQGAMQLDLLTQYAEAESARKGGPRKTVMEAIGRQAEEIQEIEKKKAAGK